jgi:2,3-dihydroxy-2,3-dihydro-p-cumate dehydrogenase
MTDAPLILITGAASGIGAATARCFARAGWRLVLADIDTRGLAAVGADLLPLGAAHVVTTQADVTSVDSVNALAGAARSAGPWPPSSRRAGSGSTWCARAASTRR